MVLHAVMGCLGLGVRVGLAVVRPAVAAWVVWRLNVTIALEVGLRALPT